jgi:type IV pilus assembly protein PilA
MKLQAANVCVLTIQEEVMLKSMLQHLHDVRAQELESEGAGEAGFTLIELMVVLLIIAILLAIAIPTFLGVTGSANDRAAQSNLTNAMTEANAVYQNNGQSFPTAAASYQSAAPEFSWISGAVASTNVGSGVSVGVSADMYVEILGTWSSTNTCWYGLMSPTETPVTGFGTLPAALTQGTYYHAQTGVPKATGCNAASAAVQGYTKWSATYSTAVTAGNG